MTLLFCDSFDHYTTVLQKWTSSTVSGSGGALTIGSSGGRSGNGFRASHPNGGNFLLYKALPSGDDVMVVGAAFRLSNYPSTSGYPIFSLRESTGPQHHGELRLTNSGKLYVARNNTQVGSTGTTTLSLNTWYFLEFKLTVHDSAGAFEVRINGVTEISGSSLDTRDGGTGVVDQIAFGLTFALPVGNIDYDDLYVCDANGSTNNDFLGDVRVEAIFPTGNGNSSQLVGSDGNSTDNYLLVDETPPSDSDYVESSTVGEKDTYAYGNLASTTGTVYGLQVMTRAAKTDAGTRSVASIARLSGTEVDSADKTLSTSYAYLPDIRETKPGGGSWTISDVNSAEFGVKVTA